jgi:NAD(P)-dependent dehydrogenase (short-subunit alcohol dehydrogenase family)
MSNVLISGCSSGFGLLTARTFARRGHRVFATVRDPARAGDLAAARDAEDLPISILPLDVRDRASIQAAVGAALDAGPLDVLVNNAGYALRGAVEEVNDEELLAELDTNVFGVLRMVRAVAPGMRERRSGTIVNVSSVTVYAGVPFNGLYAASKAAVGVLSEALYQELAPFGVRVVVVEPGPYPTRFLANQRVAGGATADSAYAPWRERAFAAIARRADETGDDPQQVADAIHDAVTDGSPRFRYVVGSPSTEQLVRLARTTEFETFAPKVRAMLGLES